MNILKLFSKLFQLLRLRRGPSKEKMPPSPSLEKMEQDDSFLNKMPMPEEPTLPGTNESRINGKDTVITIPEPESDAKETEKITTPIKTSKQPGKRKNHDPLVDTRGFRIIEDKHDLHRLFGGDEAKEENDFSRMFEESQSDVYQLGLFREKERLEKKQPPKVAPTPSQRIKTLPPPQMELDLHGYTAANAEEATGAFINRCRAKGFRTIRLIVGKGLHSQGKAVLPNVVERKVRDLKQQGIVMALNWEKKEKRKSGSLIVYLEPRGAGSQ